MDTKSGRSDHAAISSRRRQGSGSIHAPVDRPTGRPGQASRIASSAASHASAASVSSPSTARGCTWTANAPAAAAAAASVARSAGVSGSAGWSPRRRVPLRQAFTRGVRRIISP